MASFEHQATLWSSRDRNAIAYSNNLVLPGDPHRTRIGLQKEGYRWLELKVNQTEHELAGQLEVGHRDCSLPVVMVPGHEFYLPHHTSLWSLLHEAKHGQSQYVPHIILFFNIKGKRAGMARELITKEKAEWGPADPWHTLPDSGTMRGLCCKVVPISLSLS